MKGFETGEELVVGETELGEFGAEFFVASEEEVLEGVTFGLIDSAVSELTVIFSARTCAALVTFGNSTASM